MKGNRIYFKDNPWPEGHPIKTFDWSAKEIDGDVWFDMHLESADYYAERDIDDEGINYPSDWEAANVWGNYHSCTLSSNCWHYGGFRACTKPEYTPDFLDGLELEVDSNPDPELINSSDAFAFHIYLLGHDAVAKHKFKFQRSDKSTQFNIIWTGMIALAYVGDYEFKHMFSALISTADFPEITATD